MTGHSACTPTSSVVDETAKWLVHDWRGVQFKYPPDWKINKNFYASAATQARGEVDEIGLWLHPQESASEGIGFGGIQFSCQTSTCKCFELYAPVHTCGENAEVQRVFDLLIKTIRYAPSRDAPTTSFQISFPAAQERLKVGKTYTLTWTMTPGVHAQKVDIDVRDTSRQGDYRGFVLGKDLPNTGRYEWTVPVGLKSEGPYLITILHSGTRPLHTPFSPYGWSDPFYIVV
ncbi:MAG: Ser-Thr-rich GPI-anchored membrane family protein [Candidatus Binatia bacterium]